jgi:drug/metabolite transporter (DMT)-like permease
VQIGIAYLALASAMPHVPALEASTLLLVEPALNPAWAYLVHGERPRPLAWVGGAVIVLAAAVKTWWDARHAGRPPADPAGDPPAGAGPSPEVGRAGRMQP